MRRAALAAFGAAVLLAGSVAYAVNQNPLPGSVWTWLGPTFGADWVAPPANLVANTPELYGAIGDGLANDTTPMLSCLTASSTNYPCLLKTGKTYIVDNLVIPSNTYVQGAGTIKRRPNSVATKFLSCDGCSNVNIRGGVGIDGNKANQTVAADNLYFKNYVAIHLDNMSSSNAKYTASAPFTGNGVVFEISAEEATSYSSTVTDSLLTRNDYNGLHVVTSAWQLQVLNTIANYNGQYGAYFGPTGPANNIDSTLRYITVKGGDYSYNGNSGLAAQGFIQSYIASDPQQPVYGPGIEPVVGAKFIGVTAHNNNYYGIVFQARTSLLADSVTLNNTVAGSFGGGVLGNGEYVDIVNVTSVGHATGWGLDLGCGVAVNVVGGEFSGNQIGIGAGCSQFSSVRGAFITNNTTHGIAAVSSETDGDNWGIPGYTQNLVVAGNRIGCTGATDYGIRQWDGALALEVSGNYVQGCAVDKAISVDAASAIVRDNSLAGGGAGFDANGTDVTVAAATTTLTVPVWAGSVMLTGTNNFSNIKTYEQVAVGTGVSSVYVTNGGSGYPKNPIATWTGCSVAPTGTAYATRGGKLTGYRMITPGTCTTPGVTFSGGTGAVVTIVGTPQGLAFGKTFQIVTNPTATLTIGGGGNVVLASAVAAIGGNSILTFRWMNVGGGSTSFLETARVAH